MGEKVEAYPYFKIAQQHNVYHGTVLLFVDALEKGMRNLNYWENRAKNIMQKTEAAEAIMAAWKTEKDRQCQSL